MECHYATDTQNLQHRCKERTGDFNTQKHQLATQLEDAQNKADFSAIVDVQNKLDQILQREEIFWH